MDQGPAPTDTLPDAGPAVPAAVDPERHPTVQRVRRRWPLLLGILILAALLAGAAYWFLLRPQPAKQAASTDHHATSTEPAVDASNNTSPTTYISKGSDLNLNFTYPANWQVTPPSGGNQDDRPITATSPPTRITNAKGETVTVRAVFMIRPKGSDLTELDAGTAAIVVDSIQIAYNHPTKVQHGYPYISFIYLLGGDNPKKSFDEVMITGATKFSAGQQFSIYNIPQLDPVISVTFYQCVTDACSIDGSQPGLITNDFWQTSSLGQQALAIFKSLEIH